MKPHLLVVEDDELLRDVLSGLLSQAGYQTSMVSDGRDALTALSDPQSHWDGVVLDLGLPGLDGLGLLQRLRHVQSGVPVLILTARDGVEDRVAGLNAGADDYLTKPFNRDELLARVQAMLRRSRLPAFGREAAEARVTESPSTRSSGQPLTLDDSGRAWLGERELELTQREWALLNLLYRQVGQVVDREAVENAWGADEEGESGLNSNALEVYIHRLRRKLAGSAWAIRNVRGLGYLLDAER